MKALFICLGSVNSGLGHVTRSRTVALAAKEFAWVRMVVVGDGCAENLLVDRGLDYILVENDRLALEQYQAFQPEIVFFDTLKFDPEIFHQIHEHALTASLSPIFNCLLDNHLIFHRTKFTDRPWHEAGKSPTIFCGLDYTVVSEQCQIIPDEIYRMGLNAPILSLAISMGGTDAANKTLKVIQQIKTISGKLLVWVMLGEGYSHSYQEIVECMRGSHHEIILAKTNDSMWRILNTCSLAILAGGTTTYEAAYSRLPSLNFLEKPENYFLIQELVEKGVCSYLTDPFSGPDELCATIEHLNNHRQLLLNMHLTAKELIDHQGAKRIVAQTISHYHEAYLKIPRG